MAQLTLKPITLSEEVWSALTEQARRQGWQTLEDFVAALIEKYAALSAQDEVTAEMHDAALLLLLDESLVEEPMPMTTADWDEIETGIYQRHPELVR